MLDLYDPAFNKFEAGTPAPTAVLDSDGFVSLYGCVKAKAAAANGYFLMLPETLRPSGGDLQWPIYVTNSGPVWGALNILRYYASNGGLFLVNTAGVSAAGVVDLNGLRWKTSA